MTSAQRATNGPVGGSGQVLPVRFSLRSIFVLTAVVAGCIALLFGPRQNGEFVALWFVWAYLWVIGTPTTSRWRFVWWSWAAFLSMPAAATFQLACGYRNVVPVFGRLPRLGSVGNYVVGTVCWLLVMFGFWCSYKSWTTPSSLAKVSGVVSALILALGGAMYAWLLVR